MGGFFIMDTAIKLNNPKVVRAWYMYDWANSVYSLVITSAIFPIYYKSIAVSDQGDLVTFLGFEINNSVLYSYSLSFSFLVVAAILPLLSGMADYGGKKKSFMKMFVLIGSASCAGLLFFKDVSFLEWGIFCNIMASIGYSGSLVFYDAYLPEIVTKDRYDSVSAKGYSMGYYGGVILLVSLLVMITFHSSLGFANEGDAVRFSFLIVGLWWIGFSVITFNGLPNNPYNRKVEGSILVKGYQELLVVWKSFRESPALKGMCFPISFSIWESKRLCI